MLRTTTCLAATRTTRRYYYCTTNRYPYHRSISAVKFPSFSYCNGNNNNNNNNKNKITSSMKTLSLSLRRRLSSWLAAAATLSTTTTTTTTASAAATRGTTTTTSTAFVSIHHDAKKWNNSPCCRVGSGVGGVPSVMSVSGGTRRRFFSATTTDDESSSSFEVNDNDHYSHATNDNNNNNNNESFASSYHAPVMWKECIDALLAEDYAQRSMELKRKQRQRGRKHSLSKETNDPDKNDNDATPKIQDHENHSNTYAPAAPRYFVDGTLGGGGHSEALLQRLLPGDVLFGCDVDPDALATASERLARYMRIPPNSSDDNSNSNSNDDDDDNNNNKLPLFIPVRSNFCQLAKILPTIQHPQTGKPVLSSLRQIDGILLDLGVSSFQIDTAERGFAFMKDGPLDMRMDSSSSSSQATSNSGSGTNQSTLSAADVCNEFDVAELSRLLKVYGDEPRCRVIANAIVEHRPLRTTADLVQAVASVTPEFAKQGRRKGRTATLARVFQALRIFVNREDEVLEQALMQMAPALLKPGGRLVVLSYHSMEDRMAKRTLRDGSIRRADVDNEKDLYGNYIGTPRPFEPAGKAAKATDEEVKVNPRARSATLRVGIRQE